VRAGARLKEDEAMPPAVQQEPLVLRRFTLLDGRDLRLYCRLLKVRSTPFASFRLYEDNHGRRWLEIAENHRSWLTPLLHESFEERVAAELLALGINKYSG
jgi:hypothetical protein